MSQAQFSFSHRHPASALLSLTHPSKELFHRQRALLRKAVPAGIPAQADDCVQGRLSLDDHLIQHKESTFFMRVAGDSMSGLGIFDGDLLVVDRAIPAYDGCIVIAIVNGEFTVKQLLHKPTGSVLRAAHPDYRDMPVNAYKDFSIWGVVSWNVHKHTP